MIEYGLVALDSCLTNVGNVSRARDINYFLPESIFSTQIPKYFKYSES